VTFNEAKPKRVEPPTSSSGKGKGVDKIWDMPRSKEVRRLEGIIGDLKGLQNSEGKTRKDDSHQDCFCQGTFRSSHDELLRLTISTKSPYIPLHTPLPALRSDPLQPPETPSPMSIMPTNPTNPSSARSVNKPSPIRGRNTARKRTNAARTGRTYSA
jgi:hypothetical protein